MLRWMRSGRCKFLTTTLVTFLGINFFLYSNYVSHSKLNHKPLGHKQKIQVKSRLNILDNADPDILINDNPFGENYDEQVSSEDPSSSGFNQDPDDYDKYKVYTATERLTAATSVMKSAQQNQAADHYKVFNNPWFVLDSKLEDPLGSNTDAFTIETVQKCQFRSFSNHSFFSVPEFVPDYIKFRDCIRGPETNVNTWLNQQLTANLGTKGELSIDTSRMSYDIDEVGFCLEKSPTILFIVMTHVNDEEGRKIVRDTWGSSMDDQFKVIFFTGRYKTYPENIEATLPIITESDAYNDIIQTNIEDDDVFHSTKQLLASLMWTYERCPLARFISFSNVNTFINIKRFKILADKEMYAANRIYGTLLKRMEPNRDPKQVHFVNPTEWPWSYFPPFVKEPLFVISSDLVPRLLMAATTLDMLTTEQVYLTGIVALLARAMRIDVSNFFLDQIPPETSKIHSNIKQSAKLTEAELCVFINAGAIHQVKTRDQMQTLFDVYKEVNTHNATCNTTPKCYAMVEGKCLLYSKKKT